MITILHGENLVLSRQALSDLADKAKKSGHEVIFLDAKKTSLAEIRASLESGSMFGSTKLVILENLFSLVKSKEKEKILAYLEKGQFDSDLVCWDGKEVSGQLIKGAQVRVFKLSTSLFKFLDSLRPGNTKESLLILLELKKTEKEEMIFYMIIRQFRFLLIAKDSGEDGLKELSGWQQKKYLSQSSHFSPGQLKEIYQELLLIDFWQKTSKDAFSLSSRLDLLVSEI